jgi:hypothetical protein
MTLLHNAAAAAVQASCSVVLVCLLHALSALQARPCQRRMLQAQPSCCATPFLQPTTPKSCAAWYLAAHRSRNSLMLKGFWAEAC